MNSPWKTIGWAGGTVGAVLAGVVAGTAAQGARNTALRRLDPYADEPLGALKPSREFTVAADDGLPLSAEEVLPADGGEPQATVVLVHGYTLDRRTWHFQRRDLARLTAPRVRLVLYDQRSHGRSGRGGAETATIDQLGRDLAAVLRAAVPEGPIVLVGHSMGGMSIMALAEEQPELFADRVCGVALIGTAAGEVGRSGLPRPVLSSHNLLTLGLGKVAGWRPEIVEKIRGLGDGITWNSVRVLAFGDREISPSLVDLTANMINTTPVRVITDFLETLNTHNRYAALAGLRHCEVLVIGGDADRLTPFSHSEVIAAELPDAELVRAPGAGHMVMLEQPDLVTGHVAGLLQRCVVKRTERRRRWWRRA
jgi:pimeloyl-ACP methyl ester carboxylesterase